jgi:broad specificity phosphatase PhoE
MSIVKMIRHSITSSDDILSSDGVRIAKEYGITLREQYPDYKIIAHSSNAKRAKHTARLIMNSAGTEYDDQFDSDRNIDERLFYRYTDEELGKIRTAKHSNPEISILKASIQVARDALYRDIIKVAEFADQYAAESASNVVYIGVTHSPTIEGVEYIVTDNEMPKKEPNHLQGFTLKDGRFIPDEGHDRIPYDSLVEMCRSRWKLRIPINSGP